MVVEAQCVYCGKELKTEQRTKDHVIPKGFLQRPLPEDLVTVVSCRECQDRFQVAEQRVRDTVVRGIPGWEERHDQVSSRTQRSVLRTPGHNPTVTKTMMSRSGLLYQAETLAIPQGTLETMFFSIMTRGLYYERHGEIMGDVVYRVGLLTAQQVDPIANKLPVKAKRGNNDEICWATGHLEGDTRSSIWLYVLYNAIGVGVWTGKTIDFSPDTFAKGILVGGNPDSYD